MCKTLKKKKKRFPVEINWWDTMLNSHNAAFPHPLLNSRASPYPGRRSGGTAQAYKHQPSLRCPQHGDAAALSFLTHLQGPSLHFISSGVGLLNLSLLYYVLDYSSLDTYSKLVQLTLEHTRVSFQKWLLTLVPDLKKRAQGLQEPGKKQPNQQFSIPTISIHSLGTYSQFLSQEKQPALRSKKSSKIIPNTLTWVTSAADTDGSLLTQRANLDLH